MLLRWTILTPLSSIDWIVLNAGSVPWLCYVSQGQILGKMAAVSQMEAVEVLSHARMDQSVQGTPCQGSGQATTWCHCMYVRRTRWVYTSVGRLLQTKTVCLSVCIYQSRCIFSDGNNDMTWDRIPGQV